MMRNEGATSRLRQDIEDAINKHSTENGSDTPDFVLADFLLGRLAAFDQAVNLREGWYGRHRQSVVHKDGPDELA